MTPRWRQRLTEHCHVLQRLQGPAPPQSFISMAACVSVQVEDRLCTKGVQDPEAAPPIIKDTLLLNVSPDVSIQPQKQFDFLKWNNLDNKYCGHTGSAGRPVPSPHEGEQGHDSQYRWGQSSRASGLDSCHVLVEHLSDWTSHNKHVLGWIVHLWPELWNNYYVCFS